MGFEFGLRELSPQWIVITWLVIVVWVPVLFGHLYFWWIDVNDYRRAIGAAQFYKEGLETDCANLWRNYVGPSEWALNRLYWLEEADEITHREELWGLIPYLEELKAVLSD